MEKYIDNFHTSFYITEIQNLSFHLTHIRIVGTNQCGNTRHEEFKRRRENKDVLCHRDYAERLVASFAHQIKSECYGVKRSISIEEISS